jgi:hypothetical protein
MCTASDASSDAFTASLLFHVRWRFQVLVVVGKVGVEEDQAPRFSADPRRVEVHASLVYLSRNASANDSHPFQQHTAHLKPHRLALCSQSSNAQPLEVAALQDLHL